MPNVERIDYADHWERFFWLTMLSHFILDWDDMKAMDSIEGRR